MVAQEGVVLSRCRILDNMTFWPQMSYYRGFFYKTNGLFQCETSFCVHDEDT